MKKFTILKGCHYSNFFPSIRLLKSTWKTEKTFKFDESCKYEIEEESCVNKLFGFCFGLFGVHKNSIRFGWTYNKELNEIFIWSYVYKQGKLTKKKIFSCELETEHKYTLTLWKANIRTLGEPDYYVDFHIDGKLYESVIITTNKKCILTLGPYFGGHTRAPHKMIIEEK